MIAIDDEISSYPEVSLKEARIKHEKLRSLLHHGIDPSMDRQERALNKLAEQDNSFKSIATLWFKSWKTNKTDQHQKAVWNRLENDLFPHLGKLPIADITAQKILMVIKKIEARGALDIAKRTFQTTGQIYRYAVAHGYCERNPARDIKPSDALKPRESKNFARVDAKELPELLRKIDGYAEISPSGKGIKLFTRSNLAISGKKGNIEVYRDGRYFTVTGHTINGHGCLPDTVQDIGWFVERHFGSICWAYS
jgi:integrase